MSCNNCNMGLYEGGYVKDPDLYAQIYRYCDYCKNTKKKRCQICGHSSINNTKRIMYTPPKGLVSYYITVCEHCNICDVCKNYCSNLDFGNITISKREAYKRKNQNLLKWELGLVDTPTCEVCIRKYKEMLGE